jgi:hypothetical protein
MGRDFFDAAFWLTLEGVFEVFEARPTMISDPPKYFCASSGVQCLTIQPPTRRVSAILIVFHELGWDVFISDQCQLVSLTARQFHPI